MTHPTTLEASEKTTLTERTDHLSCSRLACVYENAALSTSSTGAVPRLLAQLLESLAQAGDSTDVIAASPGGTQLEKVRNYSGEVGTSARLYCRLMNSRIGSRFRGAGASLETTIPYQFAKAALKSMSTDIDDSTVLITATMTVARLARELVPQARIVYWMQGMPRLGQEKFTSQAVAGVDAIVAPSGALYRDLFELICRDRLAAPVWVIPNTFDQSQFRRETTDAIKSKRHELGVAQDEFAIMHVGRAPEKGLQVMRAALRVGDFPGRVVLISAGGKAQGRRSLHPKADILEIGKVAPQELNRIYQVCQLGVVPSVWWENCPVALIEMMSLGLCPIGSRVGGIPEMIDHGDSGWLIDTPNDPNAWASAIRTLMEDDQQRKRLSLGAEQAATDKFDRDKSLARWCDVLNTVAAI